MKNAIAITAILFCSLLTTLQGQINLNFFAGTNYSNTEYKNEGSGPNQPRLDYFIGLAPTYQVNEKIQILCNIQYSRKGYKKNETTYSKELEFRYSYIDIIPEVDFMVFNHLKIGFGINTSYNVSTDFKYDEGDWRNTTEFKSTQSFDFGLTGKIKYSYNNLFVFARYYHGLYDTIYIPETTIRSPELDRLEKYNRNLQLGIGYTLNLKRKINL